MQKKVQKATEFKLKLNFNIDDRKLWKDALKDILIVFEYYLKRITGEENVALAINNILPYFYFKPYLEERFGFNLFPAQYILNLGYTNILLKNKEFRISPLLTWKDVGLRLILPIYFLLKYTQDPTFLDKAYKELKKFIKIENKDFWYLRERALKAFGLYYTQRLL